MGAGGFPAGTFGAGAAPVPQAPPMTHGQPSGTETAGTAVGADRVERGATTVTMTDPAPAGGPTPRQGWTAPDRPELSPGEQVAGWGSTAGITCAASEATDSVPAGSMCVWSGTGMSGRTFVVSTDPAGALERTAELRAAMPAATS
jgi:hypothetical protein